jgi:oligoribonuclease (3'-5' exoribonuclease)
MHDENHLWDDIGNWMTDGGQLNADQEKQLPSIFAVDTLLTDWISNLKAVYDIDHVEMAGSAVGQFDMQLCNRDFPLFMKQLHHRVFDVRSLKTMAEMTGQDIPDILVEPKHRAMSDCQSELRYARQFLRPFFDTSAYAEHVEKTLNDS